MREYKIIQLIEEDIDTYNNYYLNHYELVDSPKSTLDARAREIQRLFINSVKQSFKNK